VAAREANLGKPVTNDNNDAGLTPILSLPDRGYALFNGNRAVISRPRFIDAGFSVGAQVAQVCESAWNKDPVFGVIGIQSGPRDGGSTVASVGIPGPGWGCW
jgi:hypothetical protein